jgi:tellurium resistance protein TerD
MAINLVKGERIQIQDGYSRLKVEMGWGLSNNTRYDLDASTFLIGKSGQIEHEYNFVFYGSGNQTQALNPDGSPITDESGNPVMRPVSLDKSVLGSIDDIGDDTDDTGEGSEEIEVDLTKTAEDIKEILFTVSIYYNPNDPNDPQRRFNFGQVRNAFIQIKDAVTNDVICRYDLDEDFSTSKGVEFGRLYRHNGNWKFQAIGDSHVDGLISICNKYASRFM